MWRARDECVLGIRLSLPRAPNRFVSMRVTPFVLGVGVLAAIASAPTAIASPSETEEGLWRDVAAALWDREHRRVEVESVQGGVVRLSGVAGEVGAPLEALRVVSEVRGVEHVHLRLDPDAYGRPRPHSPVRSIGAGRSGATVGVRTEDLHASSEGLRNLARRLLSPAPD